MNPDRKMLAKFFGWMNERHQIYINRFIRKLPPPWTKDSTLSHYKFTNVFRRLDAVSVYWREHIYEPHQEDSSKDLLFNTILFRAFNLPSTWERIGWRTSFNRQTVQKLYLQLRDVKPLFNGAYVITAGGRSGPKVGYVLKSLLPIFTDRQLLISRIQNCNTLEGTVQALRQYQTLGPFTAYEVACDLRETYILERATDTLSWTNAGPGCKRGLNRVFGRPVRKNIPSKQALAEMRYLFQLATTGGQWVHDEDWGLELREIEHSLCEFDKYIRVANGEGHTRKYHADTIRAA